MSERFYYSNSNDSVSVQLDGPEARHISRVMRMQPGDRLTLFNGTGQETQAVIESLNKNSVDLTIDNWKNVSREPSVNLVAVSALPKGDRLKFMVEKLTELGVKRLVPLVCQRSNVKPRENTIAKIQRYVIEASKQCYRNLLMQIDEPVSFGDALQMPAAEDAKQICLPNLPAKNESSNNCKNTTWIMTGPEGGFTSTEVELAISSNWDGLSLGPTILRAETAIIAACANTLIGPGN